MAPDTESYIEVRGYYVETKTASQSQIAEQGGLKASADFFARIASTEIGRLLDGGNPGGTAPTDPSAAPLPVPATQPSSPAVSNSEIRPPLLIDISKDPTDENRDKLPFPSEEAWVSASPVSIPAGPPSTKSSAERTASSLGFGIVGAATGQLLDATGSQASGGSVPSTGSRTVDLPVNAYDVVLVIRKKVK